ncbi:hypothetical protein CAI21_04975 [Alkalilimnicola ehrlichii]|uniref:DUF2066 domain-containing protein n=1 Tax=Alkalilimnicola ehrlichii TaxID=351052 RepID=UPI000E2F7EC1|nr:DUF2066 domain-containing protein [Alkalilimnicola ehrlichii]RFA30431.1 hypothetical protein CAI21_04975 [Alkalilimnicola ehrlichii]
MHKPLAFLFGLILCVSSAAVGAAPRDEGFQVRVPVANQSSGEREEAVREAFKLLLVRLSGQRGIVEEESVAEILERSSRYVQRFRYDTTDAGLQLNVHFDSATVTQALERYEIPVWRNDRPPVLIWLAVDGGSDRMLVGAHEHGAVRLPLAGAARELGVSLLFPLLDLEDLAEVGFSDVWGGFTDNIRQASTRYGNPIVVVGRVHQQRGHWVGRWQILNRSSGAAWHSDGRDLDQSLQAAVETLAQRLVPEYTAVPRRLSVADTLLVEIQGVPGLREYRAMEHYLREQGSVQDVQLQAVRGDAATFRVSLDGHPDRLLQALRSNRRLQAVHEPDPSPLDDVLERTPAELADLLDDEEQRERRESYGFRLIR